MARYATLRTADGTRATLVVGDELVVLDHGDAAAAAAHAMAGERVVADGPRVPLAGADLAPVVVAPRKIVCVGLNYRTHILELDRGVPEAPTLFSKFALALTGPYDDLVLPAVSDQVDWEAELGVVIGTPARDVTPEQALDHVAGYTVVNDVSMRDWQWRTTQWLAGKTFEATTPVGPVLVTPDEVDHARDLAIDCWVDDEQVQSARTSDLLFSVAELIADLSRIMTLEPGDLLATGTPGGVGAGHDPQRWLRPGETLRTTIEGIGELRNAIR